MNYREIITSLVWYYLPKKKNGISAYGGIGICGISVSIKGCSITTCLADVVISGKLQSYLADVEEQAQELFDRLMKQCSEHEGITEKLKAENQMEWVGRMNALRSAVVEIVNTEVIFV